MSATIIEGQISYINHEKQYALIEYFAGGKKRNITGSIGEKLQSELQKQGLVNMVHPFAVGDVVQFQTQHIKLGDKMKAINIVFKYNTALDTLINKSKTNNDFVGYIKKLDEQYFIKEIDSYLFLKLDVGQWQLLPSGNNEEMAVHFMLNNADKQKRITASLLKEQFSPAYQQAKIAFKAKKSVSGIITKISAHAVYVDLFDGEMQGKMLLDVCKDVQLALGKELMIQITHLGKHKIVITPAIPV